MNRLIWLSSMDVKPSTLPAPGLTRRRALTGHDVLRQLHTATRMPRLSLTESAHPWTLLMNRTINSLLLVGLSACAAHASADDSMTRTTPTGHQMMKDCIERQKMADVTMSQAEMKRICKEQLKQQKQTGVPADPAPTDPPHN